jgi:hypothetical protein
VIDFFSYVVKLWLSLAIVKTTMGYVQLPMILRVIKKTSTRELSFSEKVQMVLMSPLVNVVALPHFVYREGWRFFQPYDEDYVEKKLKDLGPF